MGSWISHTVLSGSSISRNGTNSHTCTFTPATASNFLVAVVAGSVTFTTPAGWTLVNSAVNNAGLYVFAKTAVSGESSFTTTHNGSNYPILGVVYEYYAGTSVIDSNSATGLNKSGGTVTTPQVAGLTGIYARFGVRCINLSDLSDNSAVAWTTPTIEDYDTSVPRASGTDGIGLSIAYDEDVTGSTFTPSSAMTGTITTPNGEGISYALRVMAPVVIINNPTATVGWLTA